VGIDLESVFRGKYGLVAFILFLGFIASLIGHQDIGWPLIGIATLLAIIIIIRK
jgi:hypothetical protein